MTHPHQDSNHLPRRDFIKLAGAGAALPTLNLSGQAEPQLNTANSNQPAAGKPTSLPVSRVATQTILQADVLVAGGGMSGVCAAIAAARNGATVVLLQDRSVLGGNSSSEVRMHICGADCHGGRPETDARESGILDELRLEEAIRNPQRCHNLWDVILYEWVTREPNITLLLNTHCYAIGMAAEDRIETVYASRHSTEDYYTIHARLFIDCTGDGRLGAEAGAAFRIGREAQSEYSEESAVPEADTKTMGSTILFTSREYGRPMPFKAPAFARKFPDCEFLPHRKITSWEYGYWWLEWGGELDIIKDNERIRDELLAVALGVWDHIKNSGCYPQSENWALEWIGALPGKRESRRFIGDYVLKQQDLENAETFPDGVAYGGWGIDLHPPAGVYSPEPPFTTKKIPLYNIPLRSLYSKNISNLLFAGRNISATHVAFGSTRVMATCSVIGQAAGTAAALCAKHNCTPRELGKEAIGELQQQLLKDDAYIIGVMNADPYDPARRADVRASSETTKGRAVNIINGVHRAVKQGFFNDLNRWESDPAQAMPQWIELRFPEPQRIREIHLVFDTALNRQLTLSQSDWATQSMIRGAQPETVRDYELEILDGESALSVARIEGNYQRKRIHTFEKQTAGGIRLTVHATHGDPSARVYEIRGYA